MKTPIRERTAPLLRSLLKQLEELTKIHQKQNQEFQQLREEVESLRRELTLTMESLSDLPYVSGVLH